MVCNGADEGVLSDGEQDADAMALDCCCCESDIWCVIVLMLVIDCSIGVGMWRGKLVRKRR